MTQELSGIVPNTSVPFNALIRTRSWQLLPRMPTSMTTGADRRIEAIRRWAKRRLSGTM